MEDEIFNIIEKALYILVWIMIGNFLAILTPQKGTFDMILAYVLALVIIVAVKNRNDKDPRTGMRL